MRYWWVSQNKSYNQEIGGSYLWSPKLQKDNKKNNSYENMTRVAPGDIVFSFKSSKIFAIGIIQSKSYACSKPTELPIGDWGPDGWKVDVEYTELKKLIRPKDYIEILRPLLPSKYSPLKSNGDGNESYLFELPLALANQVIILLGAEATQVIDSSLSTELLDENDAQQEAIVHDPDISVTEKQQLIKSRKGQGIFRRRLEKIESMCRITKVEDKRHLIASHIKPWSKSDNKERLDGNNGLLLAPHIDHLFDKGYISFSDDGGLIISKDLNSDLLIAWSVNDVNFGDFNGLQKTYLDYHRKNVFNKFLRN
jgi:putative restriction endonuclease